NHRATQRHRRPHGRPAHPDRAWIETDHRRPPADHSGRRPAHPDRAWIETPRYLIEHWSCGRPAHPDRAWIETPLHRPTAHRHKVARPIRTGRGLKLGRVVARLSVRASPGPSGPGVD